LLPAFDDREPFAAPATSQTAQTLLQPHVVLDRLDTRNAARNFGGLVSR